MNEKCNETCEVRVELYGTARMLAGQKAVTLPLSHDATLGAVIRELAQQFPQFVGPVIAPDGTSLLPHYLFNRNGRDFVLDLDTPLGDGDTILLVASAAGG